MNHRLSIASFNASIFVPHVIHVINESMIRTVIFCKLQTEVAENLDGELDPVQYVLDIKRYCSFCEKHFNDKNKISNYRKRVTRVHGWKP